METRAGQYLPSNLNQNVEGTAALSDGSVVLTYQDFQRPMGGPERAFRGRGGALETRRVWAIASTDDGKSFLPSMLVTESCFARPTFQAVDATHGPYRDRLYHVCPGDELKAVLATSSSDQGWEWSDATSIEAPAEEFGSRNFPVMAVNNEGVVAVAWMGETTPPGVVMLPTLRPLRMGARLSRVQCGLPRRSLAPMRPEPEGQAVAFQLEATTLAWLTWLMVVSMCFGLRPETGSFGCEPPPCPWAVPALDHPCELGSSDPGERG